MTQELVYRRESLSLRLVEEDDVLRLIWAGISAEKDPEEFLEPIIQDFLEKGRNSKRQMEMDFTALEFMNSLTLKPIIRLLYAIKKDKDKLGLRIRIKYSKSVLWQEVNFRSLKVMRTPENRITFEAV